MGIHADDASNRGVDETAERLVVLDNRSLRSLNNDLMTYTRTMVTSIPEWPTHDTVEESLDALLNCIHASRSLATSNLFKEYPTCNKCQELMKPRTGKYGKFYYCESKCPGQTNVSDKYWQSVRVIKGLHIDKPIG